MAALEDLVSRRQGSLPRRIGHPGMEDRRSQPDARFRGWSAFVGLQVEYSLLERDIEQELVPMAGEFGLGITPWSPLKSGVLSGKYTRHNTGPSQGGRGAMVDAFLTEQTYAVIDELEIIAKAHETTVARVALAWVGSQPS